MAVEIKMSPEEARATFNALKIAERQAKSDWQQNPSISNRDKFDTLTAARVRVFERIVRIT